MIFEENVSGAEQAAETVPLISVSCITFNHGPYLRQALDGFVNQKTEYPFEILIHDDCSADDTIEIIKEYAEKYPKIIRPMFEEENQYSKGISNISGAFNFPRARGKYIAMCEGDDFWCDMEKLQKQASYMEAHPECSMCCHSAGVVPMDNAFRTVKILQPFRGSRILEAEEVISKKENIPTASLMFRTEYAKTLPLYYHDCPVGDIPIHLYMATKGTIYYFDEVMSMYRMGTAGSWGSSMDSEQAKQKWEKHYNQMQTLYDRFDESTDGRYALASAEAMKRNRFLIDLKLDKMEVVLDPANEKFLNELPETERKLLVLRAKHPSVYGLMQKMYHLIR